MRQHHRRCLAFLGHGLTFARLLVSAWVYAWIAEGHFTAAAVAFSLAMASDLIDGPLVRRFGRPSQLGAWFDIAADLALVCAAFAGFGVAGVLPWWPLCAIAVSFLAFAATSGRRLYDPFGRSLGAQLMLAALGVMVAPDMVGQHLLGAAAGISAGITAFVRVAGSYRQRPVDRVRLHEAGTVGRTRRGGGQGYRSRQFKDDSTASALTIRKHRRHP